MTVDALFIMRVLRLSVPSRRTVGPSERLKKDISRHIVVSDKN